MSSSNGYSTFDAHAHLVETEETWRSMPSSADAYRPRVVPGEDAEHWFVYGQIRTRKSPTSLPRLADVNDPAARVALLDQLGIDVQVLYPTMLRERVADRGEIEAPICEAYNRWAGDICRRSNGRLRWVCSLPVLNIQDALDQMKAAKDHGACGIVIRPIEGELLLFEPYFDPLYERASSLDLPICVQSGNGNPRMVQELGRYYEGTEYWQYKLAAVGAVYHAMLRENVAQRFPQLRVGLMGAGAQNMVYPVNERRRFFARTDPAQGENLLETHHVWVSLAASDDIPYVVDRFGADRLLLGTELGHDDKAATLERLRSLRESGAISQAVYQRITCDNAKAFYGLS